MNDLPASLGRGDRYGTFDRESGFWTNIYVQQMAELHFNEAIKHVNAAREPRLKMLYEITPRILEMAAATYAKDPKGSCRPRIAVRVQTTRWHGSATGWRWVTASWPSTPWAWWMVTRSATRSGGTP